MARPKPAEEMINFSVHIPASTRDELLRICLEQDLLVAQVLRRAIRDFIGRQGSPA